MALVHERAEASQLRLAPVSMERATCFRGGAWQGAPCLRGWPSGGCRSHHGHNHFDSLHNPERVERTSPVIVGACLWENGGVIFGTFGAASAGDCRWQCSMRGRHQSNAWRAHAVGEKGTRNHACTNCNLVSDLFALLVQGPLSWEMGPPRLQAVFCFLQGDMGWIAPTNT